MIDNLSDRKLEFMVDMTTAILPLTETQEETALAIIALAKRLATWPHDKLELLEVFIAEQESAVRVC